MIHLFVKPSGLNYSDARPEIPHNVVEERVKSVIE